ncbi:type VI secretion system Vgr family protein [Paraburkholderia sp. EG287A]|uniref:type VI secretion system Vgr family protein n=1 Tax=unclassified Paraburkholderia TaxID=2615204 RepID=UPI0034D255E4
MNSRDPLVRPGIDIHQYYSLDIPSSASSALADIYSFKGTRAIGEPTKYTIQFTHPQHDLSRSDYINRMGSFVIQPPPVSRWSEPEAPQRVQGMVTAFAQIASNHAQSLYEVTLESRLALLCNRPRVRYFFDMSEPEVIERILREHEFNQIFADYQFGLYRSYRKRAIIAQWGEDDLAFITRLCRRAGIWFVCETGKRCEVVRFGDDYSKYIHDNARFTYPYQELNGLHTVARESVRSLEMRATMQPAKFSVRSFSPEQPNNERINGSTAINGDRTTYGETYMWGLDLDDENDAARETELRQEAAIAEQVVYRGTGDMLEPWPSCVLKLSNRDLPDVKYGLLIVSMTCSASRKEGYKVEFSAIPSDRQFRIPLKEETWPRIEGVVTGTIASTKDYVGPYLDDQGRYIVNLHPDRDPRTPGVESCPMRLAKPFAGEGQTGFHFGLEPGTVVTVAFLWGNPDRPFISQVLHTALHTDPLVVGHPWAMRHTIRTRSNNTLQMDDRSGEEHIKLATECGKSQLNLGHAVDRLNKARGEGFELRTDLKGHVRAGGGLLLSANEQKKAQGQFTDMDAVSSQFNITQAQAQGLAAAATMAKTEIADIKAENEWLKSELVGLKKAVLALSAPNGVGIATPQRMMVSTGKDTSFATSLGFNVSALKNIALAAAETVSLFAQRTGIFIAAMRGKVQIQAQSDAMELVSQLDMKFFSVAGTLTATAANGIVLNGGGSAYIKVHGDNVEIGGAGDLIIKVPDMDKQGPGSLSLPLPKFSQTDAPSDERFILSDGITGRPLVNRAYKIQMADGRIVEGVTTKNGETSLTQNDVAQGIKLMLSKIKGASSNG